MFSFLMSRVQEVSLQVLLSRLSTAVSYGHVGHAHVLGENLNAGSKFKYFLIVSPEQFCPEQLRVAFLEFLIQLGTLLISSCQVLQPTTTGLGNLPSLRDLTQVPEKLVEKDFSKRNLREIEEKLVAFSAEIASTFVQLFPCPSHPGPPMRVRWRSSDRPMLMLAFSASGQQRGPDNSPGSTGTVIELIPLTNVVNLPDVKSLVVFFILNVFLILRFIASFSLFLCFFFCCSLLCLYILYYFSYFSYSSILIISLLSADSFYPFSHRSTAEFH